MLTISKSNYLSGLQCHRLLWYWYNRKDEIPPYDAAAQAKFDAGRAVGALAQTLFPGGIGMSIEDGLRTMAQKTKVALREGKPLFEACFFFKNGRANADILDPAGKDKWDIIEVKSGTGIKDVNLHDVSMQRYVLENAGLKVNRCYLMHVNNKYVRIGDIDPQQLLVREDVTEQTAELMGQVKNNLSVMEKIISGKCPNIKIGPHCSKPYDCPLQEKCWEKIQGHSIFTLYRLGKKAFPLYEKGVTGIKELPESVRLTANQAIQVAAVRSAEPQIDRAAISAFLKQLKYPLHFLDFETFQAPIPLFENSRPYLQIPFQFSLHVVEKPGSKPEHYSFLAEGQSDPRPGFLEELQKRIGPKGSIVAYNDTFERARLKECGEFSPKHASWLGKVDERFVDLLKPFRGFSYYHPDQHGSASLKAILPVLTGKGYDGMAISDGGTASLEFMRITFGKVDKQEAEIVRKHLIEYCGQDTKGMIDIVEKLKAMAG